MLQEAMRSRQIAERLGVEEAHMLEFQQFNGIWDKKMADYERNASQLIDAMKVSKKPPSQLYTTLGRQQKLIEWRRVCVWGAVGGCRNAMHRKCGNSRRK